MRATQLRPGMTIRHEGELFTVHSVEHRTPGNKRAAMATKMRNLRTGSIIDYRFRAEVDIERAIFDEIEHEYLYSDNEGYHFMNTESYEQFHLGADVLGEAVYYLIPNTTVKLEFYEGKADRRRAAGHDGPHGRRHRADRAESHRQRGDESGKARDGSYDSGAAVRQYRRQSESGYLGSALRPARVIVVAPASRRRF